MKETKEQTINRLINRFIARTITEIDQEKHNYPSIIRMRARHLQKDLNKLIEK